MNEQDEQVRCAYKAAKQIIDLNIELHVMTEKFEQAKRLYKECLARAVKAERLLNDPVHPAFIDKGGERIFKLLELDKRSLPFADLVNTTEGTMHHAHLFQAVAKIVDEQRLESARYMQKGNDSHV